MASADASAKWDAPPSAREMHQPQQNHQQAAVAMPPREEPSRRAQDADGTGMGRRHPDTATGVGWQTLLDIQREEEARAAEAARNAPPPTMSAAFGEAWGVRNGGR